MQIGGSMSSLTASSYFDFFIEPRSVFVFDMLLFVMLAFACFWASWAMTLLFLLRPPFCTWMKHWAV